MKKHLLCILENQLILPFPVKINNCDSESQNIEIESSTVKTENKKDYFSYSSREEKLSLFNHRII